MMQKKYMTSYDAQKELINKYKKPSSFIHDELTKITNKYKSNIKYDVFFEDKKHKRTFIMIMCVLLSLFYFHEISNNDKTHMDTSIKYLIKISFDSEDSKIEKTMEHF